MFWMLFWPCLNFHFQELFTVFSLCGTPWHHLHPSSALLGEVSRVGAREGAREQAASEGTQQGEAGGSSKQSSLQALSAPSLEALLCHHPAGHFLPVLTEMSFS